MHLKGEEILFRLPELRSLFAGPLRHIPPGLRAFEPGFAQSIIGGRVGSGFRLGGPLQEIVAPFSGRFCFTFHQARSSRAPADTGITPVQRFGKACWLMRTAFFAAGQQLFNFSGALLQIFGEAGAPVAIGFASEFRPAAIPDREFSQFLWLFHGPRPADTTELATRKPFARSPRINFSRRARRTVAGVYRLVNQ